MTKQRTTAYVWSQTRKDMRARAQRQGFNNMIEDVNALVWATIYCRTSSMRVGYAYTMLRKSIKTFEGKWGPLHCSVIQEMKSSPIGRYAPVCNGFVFPTLKNSVNVVYPRGKPYASYD